MPHTPAPWFGSQRDDDLIYIHEENGKCIAMIPNKNNESSILNAQLIAVAPELLDALKWALPYVERIRDCEIIRNAIAKAEGK